MHKLLSHENFYDYGKHIINQLLRYTLLLAMYKTVCETVAYGYLYIWNQRLCFV